MDEQEKFMISTASELSSLAQQIALSQQTFEALQNSQYITEEEESEVFWGMRRWPNKLAEVCSPALISAFAAPFCICLQHVTNQLQPICSQLLSALMRCCQNCLTV